MAFRQQRSQRSLDTESDIRTLELGEELNYYGTTTTNTADNNQTRSVEDLVSVDMATTASSTGDIRTIGEHSLPVFDKPVRRDSGIPPPPRRKWEDAASAADIQTIDENQHSLPFPVEPYRWDDATPVGTQPTGKTTTAPYDYSGDVENGGGGAPFVYPKMAEEAYYHDQPYFSNTAAPPRTIMCGRKQQMVPLHDTTHDGSTSNIWHQYLCGLRADRLIVMLVMVLLLAIAVIVGALIHANQTESTILEQSSNNVSLQPKNERSIAPTSASPITTAPSFTPPTTVVPTLNNCEGVQDDPLAVFPLPFLPQEEYVGCDWIQMMMEQERDDDVLCKPESTEHYFCRKTCRNCEENNESSVWPQEVCGTDHPDATFFVGRQFGSQNCAWLQEFYFTHGDAICANQGYSICRQTCRNCGPFLPVPTPSPTTSMPTAFPTRTEQATNTPIGATTTRVSDKEITGPETASTTTDTPGVGINTVEQQQQVFSSVTELIVNALPSVTGRLEEANSEQSLALEWMEEALENGLYQGASNARLIQVFALTTFAFSTGAQGWDVNTGWISNDDSSECTWFGITCNEQGEVTQLRLPANNLRGRLPPEIQLLKESLQVLVVSSNSLRGRVPGALGELSLLTDLYMDRNLFGGEIPESVGKLQSLQRWYLERNPHLTGPFPESVADLSSLEELVFYYTNISDLTNDICVMREEDGLLSKLIFDCRQIPNNSCWSRCFYLCGDQLGIPCPP